MRCACSNPKCPNARQFNDCQHCMCLVEPDFGSDAAVNYSGPISQVCCKCSYSVQIAGRLSCIMPKWTTG